MAGLIDPWSGLLAKGGGGTAASAAYTNFAARTSGLDATHLTAYQTLLNGLTTDGFFDGSGNTLLLDCLYVFCTADATTAKLNLCQSSFNCTAPNGEPTFTADTGGYTGVSNRYLSSGFNASTAGGKYSLNSASMFSWNNSSAQDNGEAIGLVSGGSNRIIARSTSDNMRTLMNSATSVDIANTDGKAFFTSTRTSSSNIDVYKDGSSFALSNSNTSDSLKNSNMTFFVGGSFSTVQLFAGGWGQNLSSTNISNLYARLHTYLQTIAGIA